eukprot:1541326-Rhodomonas_salina.1
MGAVSNHVALLATLEACSLIPGLLFGLTLQLPQARGLPFQLQDFPPTPSPVRGAIPRVAD